MRYSLRGISIVSIAIGIDGISFLRLEFGRQGSEQQPHVKFIAVRMQLVTASGRNVTSTNLC